MPDSHRLCPSSPNSLISPARHRNKPVGLSRWPPQSGEEPGKPHPGSHGPRERDRLLDPGTSYQRTMTSDFLWSGILKEQVNEEEKIRETFWRCGSGIEVPIRAEAFFRSPCLFGSFCTQHRQHVGPFNHTSAEAIQSIILLLWWFHLEVRSPAFYKYLPPTIVLFRIMYKMLHLINLIESPGPFSEYCKYQETVK